MNQKLSDRDRSKHVPTRRHRVLHVTDTLVSGVGVVVADLVSELPDIDMRVLAYSRQGMDQAEVDGASVRFFDRRVDLLRAYPQELKKFNPDVVHFHSTRAGFLRVLPAGSARKYFSPHCYVFERPSSRAVVTRLARLGERFLSRFTDRVVAVGRYEAILAAELNPSTVVSTLPHAQLSNAGALRSQFVGEEPPGPLVAMIGRLSPQKDPEWFAEIAKGLDGHTTAIWIGGSDPNVQGGTGEYEKLLQDAGVEVTGWLNREAAMARLASADIYLHSGLWEGFPVTITEAADLGLTVMARSIPSITADLPLSLCLPGDAAAAAEIVNKAIEDPTLRHRCQTDSDAWRSETLAVRRETLSRLYKESTSPHKTRELQGRRPS